MRRSHLLVVEDNPDDEALTLRALQKTGLNLKIDIARDGAEALDYLLAEGMHAERAVEPPPQMVLLDLKLIKLSGLEVLRRVRAHPRTAIVPVVVLTTSTEEQDVLACYSYGCNSYIPKPVNFDDFARQIDHLAHYWLKINRLPLNFS